MKYLNMAASYTRNITVIILLTLFCGSNSSILSGLARFGFSPLQHTVCDDKVSDSRTCYVSEVKNISCFTAELDFDACKRHASYFSNADEPESGKKNWTYLQAYYHRHNGIRRRPGNIGSCVELKQSNCTQSRCVKTCCTGWEEDETGQCNKPTTSPCKNGGTYDRRMKLCMCVQGFSGYNCEIAMCHRGCLNGGQCSPGADGTNFCICPPYSYGSHCQHLRCPYTCEHGGYCILDGAIPTCKCPPGFYGKTCAHSYQGDSTCPPPNTTLCTDLNCRDDCVTENDCASGHVCCTDGCCMRCVKPRSPGCWNDGVFYKPWSKFRKDNCTKCICYHDGSTSCITDPVSNADDHCCFFDCKGKTTSKSPGVQRPPTINCSDEIKAVAVHAYSAYASMDQLNIIAKDEKGSILKVHYVPLSLSHPRVPTLYRNARSIMVSAKDNWGQAVVCHQKVVVVDRTPPRFMSCPSDIYAKENELVSWRPPRIFDNVGTASRRCNRESNRRFPIGLNMVTCIAIDYDDNKAFCQFNIHVRKSGRADHTPPKFVSCPHSISVTEGQLVFWQEPRAVDNVGIRSLESNHDSGKIFQVGLTMVVYTATDFNNNKAVCHFNVFVTPKHTDTQEYTEESESRVPDSVKVIAGSVSSLVVILVVVLVAVMVYRRCRVKVPQRPRSRRSGNNRTQVPIPTISNFLYSSGDEVLNSGIVPTLKPPPYSPAVNPPSYEEVFTNPGFENNAEDENLPSQPPDYDSVEQSPH